MRRLGAGTWVVLGVVVAAGVAAGLEVAGLPGGGATAARARVYENVDACLLTGRNGVNDPAAAPVWAGLEDASAATSARVSYLAVTGPGTVANAESFLGSLLVRGCRVVVASGGPERSAVLAQAPRFPRVRFVVTGATVGSGTGSGTGAANVTGVVFATSGVRAAVAAAVESGIRAAGG